MSKRRSLEDDKSALCNKVRAVQKNSENAEGDAALRRLRKRLKRVQRKIKARAARIAQATSKKKTNVS